MTNDEVTAELYRRRNDSTVAMTVSVISFAFSLLALVLVMGKCIGWPILFW